MIKINPIKITGHWTDGYALDLHTKSSEFRGYDEFNHEIFDTKRTEIGELLYKLKNQSDKTVLPSIVETVIGFIKNNWKISAKINGIIPTPSSKQYRKIQPVIELAENITKELEIALYKDSLKKIKDTMQLKDVYDYYERLKILGNAFDIENESLKGKNILLLDDLFRSGATLNTIATLLKNKGMADNIYVLTLTKTRSNK